MSLAEADTRQEVLKRLGTARDKAKDAWYLTYNGRNQHEQAIESWRQIFGSKFPAYRSRDLLMPPAALPDRSMFAMVNAMATTIPAAFKALQTNLEITDLQASTVSTRQTNVREAVEAELTVLDSFLAGSYIRDTLIAPLADADVDIFIVLDPKYWSEDGQAPLLDRVKRVLRKTYPKTPEISRNGQAVTITFTDFRVDVVPCFNRQGGGYLIPDSHRGQWIPTDPKVHIKVWADANKAHDSDLVPLMKMLKGWNKNRDVMASFPLETVTLKVLDGVTITDFPSGVSYVFDKAREKVKSKTADPAGYSDDVAADITIGPKMDAVVSALDTAYTRAKAAEELAASNKVEAAFAKWRLIFGDYFPAYG